MQKNIGYLISGAAAGCIAGLFGGGGGTVLIPLLRATAKTDEQNLFPCSVSIMLPICIVCILSDIFAGTPIPWGAGWPYLLGGCAGGILAGILAKKIPTLWLRRGLGIILMIGGIRYLC